MLAKRSEFYPFAATVKPDCELSPLAVDLGEEKPLASEMITEFTRILRTLSTKEGISAIAICYDGRVAIGGKDKKDAITVFLEHSSGECVTIYIPYQKKFLGGYQYDAVIGVEAERRIFV
jgi:hypothetical protein